MSIELKKMLPRPLVTDLEGNTLTGDQLTFTEAPQIKTALRFIPRAAPPSDRYSVKEGAMYYDVDDKTFYYYDGSSWLSLIVAVGGTPLFTPSVDNRLVRFNGTGGALQDSVVTLSDLGAMTGLTSASTGTLTASTSVSTPSLTSPGTDIALNSKNLTGGGTMAGTTATFSTQLSVPSITTSGASIDFNNKGVTNVNSLAAVTGTYSTSVSTPSITTSGTDITLNNKNLASVGTIGATTATLSTSVSTPSLTTAGTSITLNSKSLSSVNDVGAVTGTYSTSVSTPKLTSATANIDIDNKNLNNVGALNAGSVSTNSVTVLTSADMVFAAGVGNNFVFTNGDSIQTKKLIYTPAGSTTELAYWQISGEPVKRVSKFGDGWAFTNGVSGGGAYTGWLTFDPTKFNSGIFNLGKTSKGDGLGVLYCSGLQGASNVDLGINCTGTTANLYLGPSTGGVIFLTGSRTIQSVSGDITISPTSGNLVLNSISTLSASTSISTPKITTSGSTVDFDGKQINNTPQIQAGFVKAKYGGNTFYPAPVTIFNNYYNEDVTAGSPTTGVKTITVPASLMAQAGDKIFIRVSGTGVSTANTRRVGIQINNCTEQNFTLATSTGSYWTVEFECVRVSTATPTTVDVFGRGFSNTSMSTFGNASLACNTFNSAGSISLNITSTTTGDVKLRNVMAVFYPQNT